MNPKIDTFMGITGLIMAILPQYMDFIDWGVRLAVGIGGLLLAYYSIKLKRMEIKQRKENDNDKKTS